MTSGPRGAALRLLVDLLAALALIGAAPGELAPRARAPRSSSPVGQAAELEIRTVPPLAGVRFFLFPPCALYLPPELPESSFCFSGPLRPPEGQTLVSGEDGIARAVVEQEGLYRIELLPWQADESGLRAEFSRWEDETFLPARDLVIASSTSLAVGFDVSRRVRLDFVDLEGRAVDLARVTAVTVRSSHGEVHTLDNSRPTWLQAGRALRREGRLEEAEIIYSVQNVMVDGSNVVNRGQQRFVVRPDQAWRIELLLYSAQFSARDALFGFPIGSGIELEYPDGRTEIRPFEPGGELRVDLLARGTYYARVDGAPGISPRTIFVLSRDQEVQPVVISYFDLASASLLMTALALGLLLVGRPELYARLRSRAPRSPPSRGGIAATGRGRKTR